MLQCIPILALVPLIGFWFGYEFLARVIVCVHDRAVPDGVEHAVRPAVGGQARSASCSACRRRDRWTVLTKLSSPPRCPSIFVGMRTSAGLSVVGAIVGDYFFRRGKPGIGVAHRATTVAPAERRRCSPRSSSPSLLGVAIFVVFGWLRKLAVGRWYDYRPLTHSHAYHSTGVRPPPAPDPASIRLPKGAPMNTHPRAPRTRLNSRRQPRCRRPAAPQRCGAVARRSP